jgi:fructose-bisphosphate aldolase, class II
MLVTMKELLIPARAQGYAVGAFTFWSIDSAQAAVEAAEQASMPVILQTGWMEFEYAGLANLAWIGRKMAEQARVKVALHLDHGGTVELARQAINSGFTSVMIDGSALAFEDNVALTRQVVDAARPGGVTVEAELGKLAGAEAGKSLSQEEAAQTDPDQAKMFVEQTGVDALAVAIGTAHGFYAFPPRLNFDRLGKIADRVAAPLVLHGGSGTPDEQVRRAISMGIAKVNICTEVLAAYGRAIGDEQAKKNFKYNVPALLGAGKQAARQVAFSKIRHFSGNPSFGAK